MLAALAASTRRVTIGTLVTCVAFRHPALLAKMAVTADEISGGRLVLGLGAGSPGLEHETYGFPPDRGVSRLAETLEIVGGLFGGGTVSRPGPFHDLRAAKLLPPPARRVPLLVAGNGPRLLRLTARHAQAWNTAWHGPPDDRLRANLAAMARALADAGRDPASLHVTVGIEDHPDGLADVIAAYAALGVDELIVALSPRDERSVDRLARARAARS